MVHTASAITAMAVSWGAGLRHQRATSPTKRYNRIGYSNKHAQQIVYAAIAANLKKINNEVINSVKIKQDTDLSRLRFQQKFMNLYEK